MVLLLFIGIAIGAAIGLAIGKSWEVHKIVNNEDLADRLKIRAALGKTGKGRKLGRKLAKDIERIEEVEEERIHTADEIAAKFNAYRPIREWVSGWLHNHGIKTDLEIILREFEKQAREAEKVERTEVKSEEAAIDQKEAGIEQGEKVESIEEEEGK